MTEPPVVYVTNRSQNHDYSSAMVHGALRFMTQGNYPIFKTTRLLEEIVESVSYSNANDLLLFSGSSVVAALAMSVWIEMHGQARVLLWDRTQDKYVLRVITRKDIRHEIESVRERIERSTGRLVRGHTD